MRIVGLLVLGWICEVSAAPIPIRSQPSLPKTSRNNRKVLVYAQNLYHLIGQIQKRSLKEVTEKTLACSAVEAMFQSAGQSIPRSLRTKMDQANNPSALLQLLSSARRLVGEPRHWNEVEAMISSCRGIARCLDAHSGARYRDDGRSTRLKGEHRSAGILLQFNIGIGRHRIQDVIPGSSAQRAGIRPGDLLLRIDEEKLDGMTSEDVATELSISESASFETIVDGEVSFLQAPPQPTTRTMSLTLSRNGKQFSAVVTAEAFREETVLGVSRHDNHSWNYFADRKKKLAHLRIPRLVRGTAVELRKTLNQLHAQGMRGLILDLRWCEGGFLSEAIQIAGLFLKDEKIATIQQRSGKQVYRSTSEKPDLTTPLVVLVNRGTTGGGELIAASLQDHERAKIVGQRTRGKGSVQLGLYLDVPGAYFKLTSGHFLRPNGKKIHQEGVQPTKPWRLPTSTRAQKQLRLEWKRQTLRPGPCRELLPMDDPSNDPQRQMALRALQSMTRTVMRK